MPIGYTNNSIVKATTSKCLSYSPKSIRINRNSGQTRSNRLDNVFKLKRTIYCKILMIVRLFVVGLFVGGGGLIRYLMGTYWWTRVCEEERKPQNNYLCQKRLHIYKE